MRYVEDFHDYKLLDMADGKKLESWKNNILIRPDPQIVWDKKSKPELWNKADAIYERSNTGGGNWTTKNVKDEFVVEYKELKFLIKLMGFKHTGLFPEHATNWNYVIDKIKQEKREIKVLNLFAYTGAATVACLSAGASVCHVDSSKGMIEHAKLNVNLNELENANVRYIQDDVIKFVNRELRRNNKYDAIIMDPPSYGRGKSGEVWSLEKDLFNLISLTLKLLSDNPLFYMVNTYTGGLSGTIIKNMINVSLNDSMKSEMYRLSSDEIGIKMQDSNLLLPCGITTIFEKK